MVSDARVPIIKLKDKEKSFETDISVENWANVRNAFLLKCYSECDPRVKPLVITIKLWAQKAEITDAKLHRLSGNASGFFLASSRRSLSQGAWKRLDFFYSASPGKNYSVFLSMKIIK